MSVLDDPDLCEKCGAIGRVMHSRKRVGYRHRRHKCGACGKRWNSYISRLNPRLALRRLASTKSRTP